MKISADGMKGSENIRAELPAPNSPKSRRSLILGIIFNFAFFGMISGIWAVPTIWSQPEQRQVAISGTTVAFSVSATGRGILTYQWLHNGFLITGATNTSLYLADIQYSDHGFYQVKVTDSLGTVNSEAGFLNVQLKSSLVQGWGENGQVQSSVPAGLSNVVAVAAGYDHSLALKSDGTVVGWGENRFNQIAIPADLNNVVAIAAAGYRSLALKSDGTVAAWGSDCTGGTTIPTGLNKVVAIATGGQMGLALKSDGTVVELGNYGYKHVPVGLNSVIAIAVGYWHGLALKSDGTVVAWGSNSYGQATVPAGLNNVVGIAAGEWQSFALRSDGTVIAWGNGLYQMTTALPGLDNIVAMAGGPYRFFALKSDGTVVGWDSSTWASATPGSLSSVVAIAAGKSQSLALVQLLPPAIATGLASQTLDFGQTASFKVIATGGALSYQWKKNGVIIPDAHSEALILSGVSAADGGRYTVTVQNSQGVATSLPAALLIRPSLKTTSAVQAGCGSAFLTADLNPNGLATTVRFDYGLTLGYGLSTANVMLAASGSDSAIRSAVGLAPHTTYHMRALARNAAGMTISPDRSFRTLPQSDLNRDGFADLLAINPATRATTVLYTRNGVLSGTAAGPVIPATLAFRGEADFNGDGKTDWVLCDAMTRKVRVWFMNGANRASELIGPAIPAGYDIAAVEDMNADGKPDLILLNWSTGRTLIWKLNGLTVLSAVDGPVLPSGFHIVGVDDLAGNGKRDLLLWNSWTGATKILALNGTAQLTSYDGPAIPPGSCPAGLDAFNSDDNADWLVFDVMARKTQIWKMSGRTRISTMAGPAIPAGLTLLGTE